MLQNGVNGEMGGGGVTINPLLPFVVSDNQACEVDGSDQISCPTPPIVPDDESAMGLFDSGVNFHVGFVLDGVKNYTNLSQTEHLRRFGLMNVLPTAPKMKELDAIIYFNPNTETILEIEVGFRGSHTTVSPKMVTTCIFRSPVWNRNVCQSNRLIMDPQTKYTTHVNFE